MREEELFEALKDIDPDSVAKARAYQGRRRPVWIRWAAAAACAALILAAILGIPAMTGGGRGVRAVMAAYPRPVARMMSPQKYMESKQRIQWLRSSGALLAETMGLQSGMDGFNTAMMAQLLVSEDENTVCSPLNIYIAFAALAEISDGNTRQQLLDMLGAENIETLRKDVSSLWKSNYADTPVLKSLPANSLWLNNAVKYDGRTLKTLASEYCASTFSGTPGSEKMDRALRKWADDHTGGLLKEYTKGMSLSPDTVLELLSTIYFKAMWSEEFREGNTTREIFHGTKGDTSVDMMHRTKMLWVFSADTFLSLGLNLQDSGSMFFFLPDEGVDVNALASDPDVLRAVRSDETDEDWYFPLVHLSIPKYRVSSKTDLREAVRALGVTDALDPALADFTPLTTDQGDLCLSKAEHAAMLEIDEHGVTGAAYTELALSSGSGGKPEDEIDFVLDRPFMFIVTGRDGSILFSGIVRNIE